MKTIYTGAIGYRDCDACINVAALTREACDRELAIALEDEAARSANSCDHETPDGEPCDSDTCPDCDGEECQFCNPDLWYVGPFEEAILQTMHGIYGRSERRMFLDDLRNAGVAYLAA